MLKLERFYHYMNDYQIGEYDANVLSKNKAIADYFEEVLSYGSDVNLTVNFVTSSVLSSLKKLEITLDEFFITPKMLSGVIDYVHQGKISLDHGKKILYQAIEKQKDPILIIEEAHLEQINDDSVLEEYIEQVLQENQAQVRQYVFEDKDYVVNYVMGTVMQKSNRQANPNRTLELIKERLRKEKENAKK